VLWILSSFMCFGYHARPGWCCRMSNSQRSGDHINLYQNWSAIRQSEAVCTGINISVIDDFTCHEMKKLRNTPRWKMWGLNLNNFTRPFAHEVIIHVVYHFLDAPLGLQSQIANWNFVFFWVGIPCTCSFWCDSGHMRMPHVLTNMCLILVGRKLAIIYQGCKLYDL